MVHPALCWIAAGGMLSFSTIFWIESRRVPHPHAFFWRIVRNRPRSFPELKAAGRTVSPRTEGV